MSKNKPDILEESLFNHITDNDVLKWNAASRTFTVGPEILSKADSGQLIMEAKMIRGTMLWPYLVKALQWAGNKAMYEGAETVADMKAGKGILFAARLADKKLANISQLKN